MGVRKSRTTALTDMISSRRSQRKVEAKVIPSSKREMQDCKIYFPLKGIINDAPKQKPKPKFIIVPKDDYVKSYPKFKEERKPSISHDTRVSHRSLPRKILFRKKDMGLFSNKEQAGILKYK